jgi:crotonobetaine/carnitine-CoA ligase
VDADLTLPKLIERRASEHPASVWISDVAGGQITYGEAHADGLGWAGAFESLGASRGDNVVVMLAPCLDAFRTWLGLSWLGAVFTPINIDYSGRMLAHVVTASRAKVVVVSEQFVPALERVPAALANVAVVVVVDGAASAELPVPSIGRDEFLARRRDPANAAAPQPWELACLPFTSGTTGPSKAVMVPWGQFHYNAIRTQSADLLSSEDVFYSAFPVYHLGGLLPPYLMALLDGRAVIRERFSAVAFWDDIKKYGGTLTMFSGAMSTFLVMQPPSPDDADNPLRRAVMFPVIPNYKEFMSRFGLTSLSTAYSMTELCGPIVAPEVDDATSCGRILDGPPGYEVRLVDEHDQDVPIGTAGEVMVRVEEPWGITCGYFDDAENTAASWRNGWFHTGDALRRDSDGNYFFVDRQKDAIRRRGELISSFEVEAYIGDHPDVVEVAAVGVPSEFSEEDVKAVIVLVAGSELSHEEMIEFLVPRMPRFMVPRYLEFVTEIPKTETQKVQKGLLRDAGVTGTTWDREASDVRSAT